MDQAARGHQQADLDGIAIGQHPVLLGLLDLHRAQLQGQRRHHAQLDTPQHQPPAADAPTRFARLARRSGHRANLICSARAGVVRRSPNRIRAARTTSG